MIKLPQIIGHRGACAYAPENTLASIQSAADMGIEWVELDVKLTADDVPIIFHDDNLIRITDHDALVKDVPYSAIKELDAGSWFADSFVDEKIPTLEEAVELIIELGLGLNLEIKPCAGREVETAQIALDYLARIWDDHDKIIISSFNEVSLETAADMLAGDWALAYLIDDIPEKWKDIAQHLNVQTININGNDRLIRVVRINIDRTSTCADGGRLGIKEFITPLHIIEALLHESITIRVFPKLSLFNS